MNSFDKIDIILEQKGMKSSTLAKKIGVSNSAISQWRAGRTNPSLNNLESIADALEINLSDIFDKNDLTEYEESPLSDSDNELSEQESELLKLFRAAPAAYQESALLLLKSALPVPPGQDAGAEGG